MEVNSYIFTGVYFPKGNMIVPENSKITFNSFLSRPALLEKGRLILFYKFRFDLDLVCE